MALRHENLSTLVKRHVRLNEQLKILDAERQEIIGEKGAIYNHLVNTKQSNGRGLVGGGTRYGMIDGQPCAVHLRNGDVKITALDFNDFDSISPADEQSEEG